MRLEQHLNEVAEFQIAVKDIESKMHELYRVLKKNSFQMTDEELEKALDSMFREKGVGFEKGKNRGSHFSHVIDSAGITDDLMVVVDYVPGFSKYFRRFAREDKYDNFFSITKNEFFRSLVEVISHEYRHYFQSISSGHRSFAGAATNPDIPGGISEYEYYSNPHELDAFALQAAIQNMRFGKSNIATVYFYMFSQEDPKIWRRFLKKAHANVQMLKKRGLDKYIKLR